LFSKQKYDHVISQFQTMKKPSIGIYNNMVFRKDQWQIIICYVDSPHDYHGAIFLRDESTKKILWQEVLFGAGNMTGAITGVARPRKFFCLLTDKYVCIYEPVEKPFLTHKVR
jgi:hypothetical protein